MIALAAGIFIGVQPDGYSFYTDGRIDSGNPLIRLDLGSTETLSGTASALPQGRYKAKVLLLGFLPIKTAQINLIEKQEVAPLGAPFGVKLYTKGVIVVDITDFIHEGKVSNPAYEAGIREGDVILSYNGAQVTSNEELVRQVNKFDGTPQKATVRRNNLTFDAEITPLTDDTGGGYRIGLWVRDSSAGIGMLTCFNKSAGTLLGLGHSISDSDTGQVMPVATGELVGANINGVVRGAKGAPGELLGSFDESNIIGVLTGNSDTGLTAVCVTDEFDGAPSMPIALKGDITTGAAQIMCCVSGTESELYDVEIVKINNNLQSVKNMQIKVTDPRLLERTGGIVQGMSGSPVIQNGRLIGAVTHVLVDDPTRGYAILIENMLTAANENDG